MNNSHDWPFRYEDEDERMYLTRIDKEGFDLYRTFGCHHMMLTCSLCKTLNYIAARRVPAIRRPEQEND